MGRGRTAGTAGAGRVHGELGMGRQAHHLGVALARRNHGIAVLSPPHVHVDDHRPGGLKGCCEVALQGLPLGDLHATDPEGTGQGDEIRHAVQHV